MNFDKTKHKADLLEWKDSADRKIAMLSNFILELEERINDIKDDTFARNRELESDVRILKEKNPDILRRLHTLEKRFKS